MELKYYDEWEFLQAIDLIESNPFKAKEKLEEYLGKYPKDYSAYSYYSSLLITLNKFDEAEKMIEKAEWLIKQDNKYSSYSKKTKLVEGDLLFDKFRLLAYNGKYRKLCSLYSSMNFRLKENRNIERVVFFCQTRIGKVTKNRDSGQTYMHRQIIEYNEEDFWRHIQKHLADHNSTLQYPNKNVFVPNFPVKKVVVEIKKNLLEENKLCPGFIDDTYYFKYDECGREDNRLVNYIKVICFHNTTDIITILPVEHGENFPHVDLNYMIVEKSSKEIKRASAIEKFNQRFKR